MPSNLTLSREARELIGSIMAEGSNVEEIQALPQAWEEVRRAFPPPEERMRLAEEFEENGLSDVAEHLRTAGVAATRQAVEDLIAEAAENDDPEGWRLGNLEVARDMLTAEERNG